MCLPTALLRAYFTRVNMPLNTTTAEVMLQRSTRSLRHLHREVVHAFLGMTKSAATTFSCRLGGNVQQVGNRVQAPPEERLAGGPFLISLPQIL